MQTDENLVEVYRCGSEMELLRAMQEVLAPEGVEAYRHDRVSHSLPAPDAEAGAYFVAVPEAQADLARRLLREALADTVLDAHSGEVIG